MYYSCIKCNSDQHIFPIVTLFKGINRQILNKFFHYGYCSAHIMPVGPTLAIAAQAGILFEIKYPQYHGFFMNSGPILPVDIIQGNLNCTMLSRINQDDAYVNILVFAIFLSVLFVAMMVTSVLLLYVNKHKVNSAIIIVS